LVEEGVGGELEELFGSAEGFGVVGIRFISPFNGVDGGIFPALLGVGGPVENIDGNCCCCGEPGNDICSRFI